MPRDLWPMVATLFMGSCRFLHYTVLPQVNQNLSYLTAFLSCQFSHCLTLQTQHSYHSSAPELFPLIYLSEFMTACIDDLSWQFSDPYSYMPSISSTLPIYAQALESTSVETWGWCFVLFNCKSAIFLFFLTHSTSLFLFCSYSDPSFVEIPHSQSKIEISHGRAGVLHIHVHARS